jgi:hypothetical protein
MTSNTSINGKCTAFGLPGIGPIIEIASDYVSEGDPEYFGKIAPFHCWSKSLFPAIGLSLALAILPYPCGCLPFSVEIGVKAYEVALELIPSLLGFGIGAYALIFGFSGSFLRKIQSEHNQRANLIQDSVDKVNASVLHINSMFAFPLIWMAITLLVASVHKIFPANQGLDTATWFLTFLSTILIFQLIRSLYYLGRVTVLEKLGEDSSEQDSS